MIDDELLDPLYSAPLDRFVAERDALAASLKQKGDAEAAKAVKALKKPSVFAWIINQLARHYSEETGALIEAAERLGTAQRTGGSLQESNAQRAKAISVLMDRAADIIATTGSAVTRSNLEKVSRTLLAISADNEGRQRLKAGRLWKQEQPAELADIFGMDPAAGEVEDIDARETARKAAELSERVTRAETEASRLEARADALEEEAAQVRQAAVDARRRADELRSQKDQ